MLRAAGDRARTEVALNSLAIIARERGDRTGAGAAFEEAIAANRELGDLRRLADPLSNLAVVSVDEGRLDEASRLFEQSLELDRRFDNHWGIAQTLR